MGENDRLGRKLTGSPDFQPERGLPFQFSESRPHRPEQRCRRSLCPSYGLRHRPSFPPLSHRTSLIRSAGQKRAFRVRPDCHFGADHQSAGSGRAGAGTPADVVRVDSYRQPRCATRGNVMSVMIQDDENRLTHCQGRRSYCFAVDRVPGPPCCACSSARPRPSATGDQTSPPAVRPAGRVAAHGADGVCHRLWERIGSVRGGNGGGAVRESGRAGASTCPGNCVIAEHAVHANQSNGIPAAARSGRCRSCGPGLAAGPDWSAAGCCWRCCL